MEPHWEKYTSTKTKTLTRFLLLFMLTQLKAIATPTASFTASQSTGCSPLSVQFTNTSTGAVSYYWLLGNGNTSTLENPSNLYVATGSYTITLVATDGSGVTDTAEYVNYITVVPKPNADFTATTTSSCLDNNSFSFVNNSTGGATYLWDFGDGNTSTLSNPTHSYTLGGVFTVTLIVTNTFGCADQKIQNQYITVHPKPDLVITSNFTSSCDPSTVYTFSCSTPGLSSLLWNFGDGQTSNAPNPSHTYAAGGQFQVSLIATDLYGCTDTSDTPIQINVGSAYLADFYSSNDTGCAPFICNFHMTIANVSSVLWMFGDGATSTVLNPSHLYANPGTYSVTFIVTTTSGCSDTLTRVNYIKAGVNPTVDFTFTSTVGCSPLTVNFTNLSTNYDSCRWIFGDGTISTDVHPSHTYTGNGTFTVYLKCWGSTGCTQTEVKTDVVSVSTTRALFAANPRVGCPPLNANFTNFSTGSQLTYFWDFGDGTTSTQQLPTHTYTTSGTFTVSLTVTDSSGCTNTLTKQAYIQTVNPAAGYIAPPPTTGCAPLTAQFTDATVGSQGWTWDFGDGTTSTLQNPIHTYTTPGTYVVALTTNSAGGGCQQLISNFSTFIVTGGYAGFTHTETPCPPYIATFQDTSSNAVAWLWNFGDGTFSTLQHPQHTYAVGGFHSVSLTITTADGCSYTTMQSNSIYFEPFGANFYGVPNGTTFPMIVDFFANSVGATGWLWDFGDGGSSMLENPQHLYNVMGQYNVTLTITNDQCTLFYAPQPFNFGIPDTTPFPAGNPGVPEVQFGCAPLNVAFSKLVNGSVAWQWDFGDGDTSNQQFPNHTYFNPGIYDVTLTTWDTLGLVSVFQMDSIVRVSGPTAQFGFQQNSSCQSTEIMLIDSSVNANTWSWNFGDGTTSNQQHPLHIYTGGLPNYVVSLTVTDTAGCTSSLSTSIFANFVSPLIASETEMCGLDTVHFATSLQNYPAYLWDFGDGNTSTLPNPNHVYTVEGSYTATLTVTDNSGCSQTFSVFPAISVSLPLSDFRVPGTGQKCNDITIYFDNLSLNADGYYWDFGDGNNSTEENPVHFYGDAGIYDVSLTVYRNGCIDTYAIPQAVRVDTAYADFSLLKDGICLPMTVTFTDLSANAVSWDWHFSTNDSSNVQNPVFVFDSIPEGLMWLAIVDVNGCRDTAWHSRISTLTAHFTTDVDSGCTPLTVHFDNSSIMSTAYYWDFGDGTTSTLPEPDHQYALPGVYNVMLVVDAGGQHNHCTDTMYVPAAIHVREPIAMFSSPDLYSCAPSIVQFNDSSIDTDTYLWDFGDSSTSTNSSPTHIYNAPGVYTVTLIASTDVGCADTLVMPQYVTVLGPITDFTATATEGCVPFHVEFTDQSQNAVDWSWNFGDGNSVQTINSYNTYLDTGTFTVTLVTQDTAGCSSYYEYPQKVIVHPVPSAAFSTPNTSGCMPYSTNFINASTGADSTLWIFGDGVTATSVNASHTYSIPGNYNVMLVSTNQFGCVDTAGLTTPVQVLSTPAPAFTTSTNQGCAPLFVHFTSTTAWTQGASYLWDFGNGITSTDQNPDIIFNNPGFYPVTLTVSNSNGCNGSVNFPAMIHVNDTLPPNTTDILSVSVTSNTTVEIMWANNAAIDLGGYILYRLHENSGLYQSIHSELNINNTNFTFNPHFTDSGLNTLNKVYTYKLQTLDICGNTIPLDQLTAHSTINVSSSRAAAGTGIDVRWNAYGGCPVNTYEIYRSRPGEAWSYLATVPSTTLDYLDSTFSCPHEYAYRITATDLCGNPYISNSDTSQTMPLNTFANQVVDVVRSTVEDNDFVLTEWKLPAVQPDKVVQFDLYRSTDNTNFSYLKSLPPVQTDYIDRDVDVQSNRYYYKVLVVNTCDIAEDLSGNTSTIVLKGEMYEDRSVHLTWSRYTGWENGVDYYIIEKKDDNGNWILLKQVPGSTSNYDYQE
jgi:PKD repeat protein